jgi:hypothetical protein
MSTTLYQDKTVIIDESGIIIPNYYFPTGTARRLTWSDIKSARVLKLGTLGGKLKLWGMGLAPYWFNRDWKRPMKNRFIVLDVGARVNPGITPDDVDIAYSIINDRLNTTAAKGPM